MSTLKPLGFEESGKKADRPEESESSFELVCQYAFSSDTPENPECDREREEQKKEQNELPLLFADCSALQLGELSGELDEDGEIPDEWQETPQDISERDLFELIDHLETLNEEQQYRNLLEMRLDEENLGVAYDPYNQRFNGFYDDEKIPEISLAPRVRVDEDFGEGF